MKSKGKAYKVRVVVTKTMWVTQEDIAEDFGIRELDEFLAISYARGTLVEEIRNNPLRGSSKIIDVKLTN